MTESQQTYQGPHYAQDYKPLEQRVREESEPIIDDEGS